MATIIAVEDNLEQLEELVFLLNHAGHQAHGAANADELAPLLDMCRPDIILLDYGLPGVSGAELAVRLRQRFGQAVGIIMITARGGGEDRVQCRNAGVNDYLVKPVNFNELLAVVKNLLVYTQPAEPPLAWRVDPDKSQALAPDGQVIPLTWLELTIMRMLAAAPEHKAGREELIQALGRKADSYDERALEVLVSRLRKKLPLLPDGRSPLASVRGEGYRFIQPMAIPS